MITILGELVDLNTYINAERRNRFLGAKIKKQETENVWMQCLSEDNQNQKPIKKPCVIHFKWFTRNERKDPDNVCGTGHKFVLDGLVKSGILVNDTRKYIKGFTDYFFVDSSLPRVEIELEEV